MANIENIRLHLVAEQIESRGVRDPLVLAAMLDRDLKELFRVGRRYLSVGVPVLILCLFASQFARGTLGNTSLARAVEESFIIVGWVANWKPIETFLYDWWPLKRRRDLYRRLEKANVEINIG